MEEATYHVAVPEDFLEFMDRACVRLNYLFEEYEFNPYGTSIQISRTNKQHITESEISEIKKETNNQLYRERIFVETLPIRQWLNSDA